MTFETNVTAKSFASAAPAFALPVLFLGYAVVANYEFVTGLGRDIAEMPKSATEYLNGEAAIQIDTYYKKIMPHRLPSIDAMGAARYLAFREGRPGVVVGDDGWLFSKEEFEATLKRTPDLAEAAAGVAEVHDLLAAKGIDLVVVPLPAKADIYGEHVSYPAIPTDLERLYEDFRTVLDNAGTDLRSIAAHIMGKVEDYQLRREAAEDYLSRAPQIMEQIKAQELQVSQQREATSKAEFSKAAEHALSVVAADIPALNNPEMLEKLRAASQADWNTIKPVTKAYLLMSGNIVPKLQQEMKTLNDTIKAKDTEMAGLREQMKKLTGSLPSSNGNVNTPAPASSDEDQSLTFTQRLAKFGGFPV